MTGTARSLEEEAALKMRVGKLSGHDKRLIAGMLARGDRIIDIAVWFRVSPSTVHAVKKASRGSWTLTDSLTKLPPPGPYEIVQRVQYVALVDTAAVSKAIMLELEGLVSKYRAKSATVYN